MFHYDLIENGTGKVVGRVKIKKTIKEYAAGAIEELTRQLQGVKSPKRKLRLETKIDEWKRVIEMVNAQQEENLKIVEQQNEQKEQKDTAPSTEHAE